MANISQIKLPNNSTYNLADSVARESITSVSALLPHTATITDTTVASFTDGADNVPVSSLIVDIDAVQDLHGYDKPWAGGAGKNKLQVTIASSTSQGITATVYDDGTVLLNGKSTGLLILTLNNTLTLNGNYILSGCPSGGSASTFRMDCYWTEQGALIDAGNGVAISPNGNVLTVRIVVMEGVTLNNQLFKPMICLASAPNPDYAHYEPYSNICPISGHTEANIVNTQIEEIRELFTIDPSFRGRVNFNQLIDNGNFESVYRWSNTRVSISANNNILNMQVSEIAGTISPVANRIDTFFPNIILNHKYLSMAQVKPPKNTIFNMGVFNGSIGAISSKQTIANIWNEVTSITTIQEGDFSINGVRLGFDAFSDGYSLGDIVEVKTFNCIDLTQMFGATIADYIYSLEQGTAGAGVEFFKAIYPQDYYPYNLGQDKIVGDVTPVTVNLGQTVYGGSLNVKTGVLTINTLYKTYDGSENWQAAGAQSGKYRIALNEVLDNVLYPTSTGEDLDCICNMLVKNNAENTYRLIDGISYQPNSGLRIYSDSYNTNDITPWKTLLAGTPLEVVYKLATPTTVQLTPTEVRTLLNNNNIFADTGNINELVYFKTGCESITELIGVMHDDSKMSYSNVYFKKTCNQLTDPGIYYNIDPTGSPSEGYYLTTLITTYNCQILVYLGLVVNIRRVNHSPGGGISFSSWKRLANEDDLDGAVIPYNAEYPSLGTIYDVIESIKSNLVKSVLLTSSINCTYADSSTIGYRTTNTDRVQVSTMTGYPTGKTILGYTFEYAYVGNVGEYYKIASVNLNDGYVYANSKVSGTVRFGLRVIYIN